MSNRPTFPESSGASPEIILFTGHSADVLHACFTPDGKTIVSAGRDRAIIRWSVETGDILYKFEHPGPDFWWNYLSPDGLHAVGSGFEGISIFNTTTGATAGIFDYPLLLSTISRDGTTFAISDSESGIRFMELSTGSVTGRMEFSTEYPLDLSLASLFFSPDGETLAVIPATFHEVVMLEASTGRFKRRLSVDPERLEQGGFFGRDATLFESLTFSPDGKMLVGLAHSAIVVWSTITGKVLFMSQPAFDSSESVCFSPDGAVLVSGEDDGTIIFRSTDNWGVLQRRRAHDGWVRTVSFSPFGDYLVTGGNDNAVRLWNADTSELLHSMRGHESPIESMHFSPDGRTIESMNGDGTTRTWCVKEKRLVSTTRPKAVEPEEDPSLFDNRLVFAVLPDGSVKMVGEDRRDLIIEVDLMKPDSGEVTKTFAISDERGNPEEIRSAVFSPDGNLLAIGHLAYMVTLWDVETGDLLGLIPTRGDFIGAVAFSPDGKTLAVGSDFGEVVQLFSVRALKEKRSLIGHAASVDAVAFSPDGELLASGGSDSMIKLWNPRNGKLLGTLAILPPSDPDLPSEEWLAYTPDGSYVGSEGADRFVRFQIGNRIV